MEIDRELFTKGAYIEMPGTEFWNESRTEMNIGRWSRRTFSEAGKSIPDSDIEKFVNLYYPKDSSQIKTINEKFRNMLVLNGLENVKKYHPSVIAKRYCQLYSFFYNYDQ